MLGGCSTPIVKAVSPPDSLLHCERDLGALPETDFDAYLLASQMADDRKQYGDLRDCYQRLVEWVQQ